MERLTYDFCVGDKHCWLVKGADNLECREVCRNQGENGCTDCPIAKAFDRLAAYEDTGLSPEEIERILDSYGRGMTLRTENAQRLEIIKEIPINRLRELAQAEKTGRLVVLPCEIGSPVYSHARKLDGADYVRETEFWWSDIPQMGKTVFLTREAAEATLDAMRGENNA